MCYGFLRIGSTLLHTADLSGLAENTPHYIVMLLETVRPKKASESNPFFQIENHLLWFFSLLSLVCGVFSADVCLLVLVCVTEIRFIT